MRCGDYSRRAGSIPSAAASDFHAFGPLFDGESKTHGELCDITSSLEKALADAMTAAGYAIINSVRVACR